jgi:arylsulfatase A-like enzyme
VPKGAVVDEPVSTLDLGATFIDYAGVEQTSPMHGRSLRGMVEGKGGTRDFAYNEWNIHASRCGVALSLRTVRTKRHRMTVEQGSGAGELYDFVNDPYEMDNLFDDEGARAVRKELEDMIRSRPDDIMDPLPQPVGMA